MRHDRGSIEHLQAAIAAVNFQVDALRRCPASRRDHQRATLARALALLITTYPTRPNTDIEQAKAAAVRAAQPLLHDLDGQVMRSLRPLSRRPETAQQFALAF